MVAWHALLVLACFPGLGVWMGEAGQPGEEEMEG